jgi:hypothetical protein
VSDACAAKYPSLVHTFTCTVGKKPSHARSYVNDVDEVHGIVAAVSRAARSYVPLTLPKLDRLS